jgi:hypothetical protein
MGLVIKLVVCHYIIISISMTFDNHLNEEHAMHEY